MLNPPCTPASSNRLMRRTGSPAPSPLENAERSSGLCLKTTSLLVELSLPHLFVANRAITSTTCSIDASTPSSASEVTGHWPIPQGTMCSRIYARSGFTLSANPCIVRRSVEPLPTFTPIAQILRACGVSGSSHTPGNWACRPALNTPNSTSVSIITCSRS